MAIVKIKLTKKVNNVVNDYYPKTSADNVVYDSNNTVADKLNAIETTLTAHAVTNKGSAFSNGLYKITINGEGHVTAATAVTKSDITGLGIPDAAATQSAAGLMSAADKTKLDGITSEKIQAWDAAEQNVNADWTAESGDAQILHKPDLSIYALAANVTKSALGIDNVDNTSDANKPISTATQTALAGKAAASHAHDGRYYTETEIDNKLGEKSNTGHTHDDRYYTEDETDTLLSGKADSSDIPDVSSFITKAVNDLTNYYTKSETYTQAEIDNMVSTIPKFAIEVVQALPSQNISPTTVYLLTVQSGQQGNMYDEYIHVGNSWELLGTQTVDLSGYYTSAQVDTLLSGLPVAGHTHDERYYTESEIDGKVQEINSAIAGKAPASHTHDDRYYTETEIDNKLGGKSNTGHSHAVTDVTGLDSALAGKAAASHEHDDRYYTETEIDTLLSGKAPASHTHTKSQITDLANASASAAGLMSAADFKKINAQSITSGSDLNDIKGEGWYACYTNSTAATLSHCPTTVAFYMEVHKHAGVYQHIVEYSTAGKHFHRNFYINVWGDWVEWKLTDTTYSNATPSTNGVGGSAGLMSAADKTKLNACKKIVYLASEAAYEALNPPDPDTVYMILE